MKRRVIPAIDVDELGKAAALAALLGNEAHSLKVGLELLHAEGTPRVLGTLAANGADVFADVKLADIPSTVAKTSRVLTRHGAKMFNVHAMGGSEMMVAAVEAAAEEAEKRRAERPIILAVTALTSLDCERFISMGFLQHLESFAIDDAEERAEVDEREMERIVVTLALLAMEAGLDGVVASPREARAIRRYCGPEFLIVTPGIRKKGAKKDDQNRTAEPAEAIEAGANCLVIGRPITEAPDPLAVIRQINEEIEAVVA